MAATRPDPTRAQTRQTRYSLEPTGLAPARANFFEKNLC
jgi:hypothetical protein